MTEEVVSQLRSKQGSDENMQASDEITSTYKRQRRLERESQQNQDDWSPNQYMKTNEKSESRVRTSKPIQQELKRKERAVQKQFEVR